MGEGGSTQSRVAALTGLRGLAAASVVFFHVWYYGGPDAATFPAGPFAPLFVKLDVGVTFFFVLSGFLLYRPYARALISDIPSPRLRHFAIARFLRIVPIYWIAVLTAAALAERQLFGQPWRLIANLFFVEFWFPGFLPPDLKTSTGSIAIVPSWALVVEMGFYITLPLVCFLAASVVRRTGRRVAAGVLPIVALMLLNGAAIAVEHLLDGDSRRAWVFNFPMHAGAFACGMAGTVLWILVEGRRTRLPAYWQWFVALGALFIAGTALKLSNTGHLTFADARWPVALAFALLLLLVVLSDDTGRVRSVLGARVFVGVGLASYSIFLVHDPIIRAFRSHDVAAAGWSGFFVTLAIVSLATGVLAFTSYRLLEKPSFVLKRRLTQPASGEPLDELLRRLVAGIDPSRVPKFTFNAGPIRVSEPQVAPIVRPILENAIAYGSAPYTVHAMVTGRDLLLVVEDDGRGIDPDFLPHLFEPGSRSEPSSHQPGAGLGLAHARTLARDRGGNVVYDGSWERGARFAVTLPLRRRASLARRLRDPLRQMRVRRTPWAPRARSEPISKRSTLSLAWAWQTTSGPDRGSGS